jgi:transcriptional regulator GlxA family with amidase domain
MCKNPAMSTHRPHRVAVLALDGVVAFDLGVPSQVLGSARDEGGAQLYDVRVCTPGGRPVRSSAGFQVLPDHGLEQLEDADTVLVPGIHDVPRESWTRRCVRR